MRHRLRPEIDIRGQRTVFETYRQTHPLGCRLMPVAERILLPNDDTPDGLPDG